MAATGLSADPKEYRRRLAEQPDAQIDAWAAELMRDVAKRRGVIRVLADFRKAAKLERTGYRTGVRFRKRPDRDRRTGRPGSPDDARDRPVRAGAGDPRPGD